MRFREVAMLLLPHKHTFCELHSIHFHCDFLSLHFTRASPSYITVTDEHWRFCQVRILYSFHAWISWRKKYQQWCIINDYHLKCFIVVFRHFMAIFCFSLFFFFFLLCGLYPRLRSRFFLVDFSAFVRWALNPPDTHVRSPSESCVIHRQ